MAFCLAVKLLKMTTICKFSHLILTSQYSSESTTPEQSLITSMSNKMLLGMLFSNLVYLCASAFHKGGSWIEKDSELKNMANLLVKSWLGIWLFWPPFFRTIENRLKFCLHHVAEYWRRILSNRKMTLRLCIWTEHSPLMMFSVEIDFFTLL